MRILFHFAKFQTLALLNYRKSQRLSLKVFALWYYALGPPKKGQKKIPFSVCILGSLKRCKLLRVSWLQPSYQLELLHEYGLGRAKIQENEDQLRRQAHICDLSILERKLELRLWSHLNHCHTWKEKSKENHRNSSNSWIFTYLDAASIFQASLVSIL